MTTHYLALASLAVGGRILNYLMTEVKKFQPPRYWIVIKINKFILVSTSELALPVYVKDILEAAGMEYKEVTDLEEVIGELDVLYMTRIQLGFEQSMCLCTLPFISGCEAPSPFITVPPAFVLSQDQTLN